jgi:copper homeostasis protein
MQLEVVVTDAPEALIAQHNGASRIELVADLDRGGLTPDASLIESVTRAVSIPVHVMLRPHDNGFAYGSSDRQAIMEDAARMYDLGASAIVFGALDERGRVAVGFVEEVLGAGRLPMTFHRAFDVTPNLSATYATLAGIPGVERVLTAGGATTAWEGRVWLRELCCGNTVPAVLGAGAIDASNVLELVRFTGLHEVHVGSGARTDGQIDGGKIARLTSLFNRGPVR